MHLLSAIVVKAADGAGASGVFNWATWAAWVGAATGVVALALTWRAAAREQRAQLPVGWHVAPEKRTAPSGAKSPDLYVAKLSPMFNDAHSFEMELYHPGANSMPSGLVRTKTQPVLRASEEIEIVLQNGVAPGTAFVRVYWCHPKDVTHKQGAWLPLIPRRWNGLASPAADEYYRQISRPAIIRLIRQRLLLSPIGPGRGIPGRAAGWRDFVEGRRRLKVEGVKRWDWKSAVAPLPSANVSFSDDQPDDDA